jgi:hypothetical protein
MQDVNVIIAWALGIMGFTAVLGWIIISWITGTSSGTEVPISVISGLSGILTGKGMAEAKINKEHAKKNGLPTLPDNKKEYVSEIVENGAK